MILERQRHYGKNSPKSKTPPTAPSGFNSFFPGKVIIDIRNGIMWEVLTGYGWNLVGWDPKFVYGRLTPGDLGVTFISPLGV